MNLLIRGKFECAKYISKMELLAKTVDNFGKKLHLMTLESVYLTFNF